MKKDRLVLIDVLRILFMVFIFIRHSATMGGCKYTWFDVPFLRSLNGNMLSAFFIISGFSLFYVYSNKDLFNYDNLTIFYKKRVISILPFYLLVVICHFFLESDLKTNMGLLPIEITGTHTFFNNTFSLLHNGTTWFVSCLLLSIFLFPLLQELIKRFSPKKRIILFVLLLTFLSYSSIMFNMFSITNTYSNPLFRNFEFSLGVLFCSMIKTPSDNSKNWLYLLGFFGGVALLFYISKYSTNIILLVKYLVMLIPIFFAAKYKPNPNRKYRIISFGALISYPFYILQDLIWNKNKWLNDLIRQISNNYLRILTFLGILIALCVITTYFYQKPIEKLFKRKNEKT